MTEKVKVLFVCLGNICRSPTAHGVFEQYVEKAGLSDKILVDSCGTGQWHIGQPPDDRTQKAALERGYDLSHLRARRLQQDDFQRFDYILPMDQRNLEDVLAMKPEDFKGKVQLMLEYGEDNQVKEVPDPYYGEHDGFEYVLDLLEKSSANLLKEIQQSL